MLVKAAEPKAPPEPNLFTIQRANTTTLLNTIMPLLETVLKNNHIKQLITQLKKHNIT